MGKGCGSKANENPRSGSEEKILNPRIGIPEGLSCESNPRPDGKIKVIKFRKHDFGARERERDREREREGEEKN